jgi:hypothetical protein
MKNQLEVSVAQGRYAVVQDHTGDLLHQLYNIEHFGIVRNGPFAGRRVDLFLLS